MATTDDARAAIAEAMDEIRTRRDAVTDQAQIDALNDQLSKLRDQQDAIDNAALDHDAANVAVATSGLQAVIDDARLDALGQLKQRLGEIKGRLAG